MLHLLVCFEFKISVSFHFGHYIPFWSLHIAQNVTHKWAWTLKQNISNDWRSGRLLIKHFHTIKHTHTLAGILPQISWIKSFLNAKQHSLLFCCPCCYATISKSKAERKDKSQRERDVEEGRKLWVFKSQYLVLLCGPRVQCLWRRNVGHKVSREDGEQDISKHTESAPHTHSGWV